MYDATFKICIFGDGGVGKTTLTERFLTGLFKDDTRLTIGTNFYQKNLLIEQKQIMLQIWDFGGEKQFRKLISKYIIGASGVILMYDITRFSSLKNIREWMELIEEGLERDRNISIVIVGGKKDLEAYRVVNPDIVDKLIEQYNFFNHFECSAKSGENVEEIFTTLTNHIAKRSGII